MQGYKQLYKDQPVKDLSTRQVKKTQVYQHLSQLYHICRLLLVALQ